MEPEYTKVPIKFAHICEDGTCHESCPHLEINESIEKGSKFPIWCVCFAFDSEGLDILSITETQEGNFKAVAICNK